MFVLTLAGVLPEWLSLTDFEHKTQEDHDASICLELLQDCSGGIYLPGNVDMDSTAAMDDHAERPISDLPFIEYLSCKQMYETLQHIGLCFHGGFENFARVRSGSLSQELPMKYIIVVNEARAKKFNNIGPVIGKDALREPKNLEDAARAFATLDAAMGYVPPVEQIDAAILRAKNKHDVWALEREKFLLQTKKRYRKMLLGLAREEWCQEEVCSNP